MLLIVFGAGASFDSAPTYKPETGEFRPERPPLANQLFASRERFAEALQEFPECRSLAPHLRHPAGERWRRATPAKVPVGGIIRSRSASTIGGYPLLPSDDFGIAAPALVAKSA
jgi:hypothetical protein